MGLGLLKASSALTLTLAHEISSYVSNHDFFVDLLKIVLQGIARAGRTDAVPWYLLKPHLPGLHLRSKKKLRGVVFNPV